MGTPEPKPSHPLHLVLYLFGGLCLGSGILSLYWSFGHSDPAGRIPMNTDFARVGWSALDNIAPLAAADFSIPLVVVGAVCLIIGNATAWKETGGY
jgi:hypothetical protein